MSKCYAGPPELGGCGGTKVKLFGGGINGIGGVANAIVQVAQGGQGLTGSVIGVDLVNGGGGYTFHHLLNLLMNVVEVMVPLQRQSLIMIQTLLRINR